MKLEKTLNLPLDFCLYLVVGFVPIFSSPLFWNEREFPQLAAFYFLTSLGLIFLLLKKGLAKSFTLNLCRQDLLVFLFLGSLSLSTITALNPKTAFWGLYDSWTTSFLTFLMGFIFYVLLINQVKNLKQIGELFLFVLAGASVACLSAFWQYLDLGGSLFPLEKIRLSGSLGQPNFLGSYLALVLPFSLYLLFSEKRRLFRTIFGLLSLLITAVLLFTASRTAWLAVILAAGVVTLIFFLKIRRETLLYRVKKSKKLFLGLGAVVIFMVLLFGNLVFSRITESFQAAPEQNTLLIRLYEWRGGLRVFQERPLLGVGPENLYYRYGANRDPWLNRIEDEWFLRAYSIRNIYLDFLAKTGFLGLASFLCLVFYTLRELIKNLKPFSKGRVPWLYLAVLFSYLVFLFIGIGYLLTPSNLILFWLLMALIRLLTSHSQKRIKPVFSEKMIPFLRNGGFGLIALTIIFLGLLARGIAADYFVKKGLIYGAGQNTPLFEKSVALNPLYSIYKRGLALAYLEMATESIDEETSKITLKEGGEQLAQKALELANAAVSTDPYDPVSYTNLSIFYFRLSSSDRSYLEQALWSVEKAKEIEPNLPDSWDNVGLVYLDMGNLEKAKECFEKAIALKSNYSPSHFHLGETLRQMGQPEEALPHYQMFEGERAKQEIKETLLEIEKKKRK
jgi:putative inorganic carbon (HCO3(-)) transporter